VSFGANTISPLDIEDARKAAYRASEVQREVEDLIRDASRKLAEAERAYRRRFAERIVQLHAEDGYAITMCGEIARGETDVSHLRYERDVAKGVLEAAQQQAFRRGADRRDLATLLDWSMRRDLRVDTPPPDFDPRTGEIRASRAVPA
jgi:hypothetical protein